MKSKIDPTLHYKAGIQLGIRRGDVSLAWTCFDAVWENPGSWPSLRWEIVPIVLEDIWYVIGSVASFMEKTENMDSKDQKTHWWRLIQGFCYLPKSKDVHALHDIASGVVSRIMKPDSSWKKMVEYTRAVELEKGLQKSLSETVENTNNRFSNWASDYERKAIELLISRARVPGTYRGIAYGLQATNLILSRGLCEEETRALLSETLSAHENDPIPKPRKITQDIYTCRSFAGEEAILRTAQEFNLDPMILEDAWFLIDSCNLEEDAVQFVPLGKVKPWESCWWIPCLKKKLSAGEQSANELVETWESTWKPALYKNLVDILKETK